MDNKEKNVLSTNLVLSQDLASIYSDVDGLSLQNLFYTRNGYFPNCQMFTQDGRGGDYHFDTKQMIEYILENMPEEENFEHIVYSTYNLSSKEERIGFCGVMNKSNLFFRVESCVSESYILYGSENSEALKELMATFSKFFVAPEHEKNNMWKIASTNSGYTLVKSKVKNVPDFDVDKQYNDDFKKEDLKIQKFIEKEEEGGLIILHGEKGTGKSTYIRHLINSNETKKFVFVPAAIIPLLGDPSFGTFIQSLANHIIILEDCENAIKDRKSTGSSAAVSLLLNMTDGLLEDDLGIKFICTFNEDVKNIDQALLRKGRLVSKYEFKELNADKANALLKDLYDHVVDEETGAVKDAEAPTTNKGMTLADIYNYNEDSYEEKRKSII